MRTKTSSRLASASPAGEASPLAPPIPDATAYWLEDDLGNRVSKLFASSENVLKLAGRVLDNVGSLEGWALACRTPGRARLAVASGASLELLTVPFMRGRSPEEASAIDRYNEARRRTFGPPSRSRIETDETVY